VVKKLLKEEFHFILQAKQWVPLLGLQCHPDTQLFLCSLFSPICLDRPIYPCRSLCQVIEVFLNIESCENCQTDLFIIYIFKNRMCRKNVSREC